MNHRQWLGVGYIGSGLISAVVTLALGINSSVAFTFLGLGVLVGARGGVR